MDYFRKNWDSLLICGPNSLGILGNINLISATPFAETTPLEGKFESASATLAVFAAAANPIGSVGTASQGISTLIKDIKNETA